MRRTVTTTVTARVPVPRAALFDWFVPVELPRILQGYGPVAGVTATSEQTGPWDRVGSARTVHLSDGSTAREEVTECVAPQLFGYRVTDFTNPIRLLTRQARARWVFSEHGPHATDVTWTYAFTARSRVAALLLAPMIRFAWRGFMRRGLERISELAPAEAGVNGSAASPSPPPDNG